MTRSPLSFQSKYGRLMASAPSRPLRRILALGALWSAVSAAALLAPGCYGRNCEGDTEVYGADADQGVMLDPDSWASGPMDG